MERVRLPRVHIPRRVLVPFLRRNVYGFRHRRLADHLEGRLCMREADGDGGEVVRGDEFDFVAHGLGLLFGFDEDVTALGAAFGFFGVEGDAEGFEVAEREKCMKSENVCVICDNSQGPRRRRPAKL